MPGAGVSDRGVFEPATSGSPTFEDMSPALWFPFRGLTRLSHPGKTSRRIPAAKSIPYNPLASLKGLSEILAYETPGPEQAGPERTAQPALDVSALDP